MATELNKESTAVAERPKFSLAATLAAQYEMEPGPFIAAIRQVVFPLQDRKGNSPTDSHIIAYLSVCQQYGLNPFIGHVWPFPQRDGGFKPVASVDGWIHIMNNHPAFNGAEYKEITDEKGNLIAGEMTIYRKDRERTTVHREWLSEVKRDTEPWKMQHRMLENRTICQTVRRAMGIGIPDQDDAERGDEINITAASTELSRTTNTKTEALKERIGAKKEAKKEEPKPEPDLTPVSAEVELESQTVAAPPEQEPMPIDEITTEDQSRLLTDSERNSILAILKSKATNEAETLKVSKDARQFFMTKGAASTKQITLKDLASCLAWAESYKV
jgi:hypothetical protein